MRPDRRGQRLKWLPLIPVNVDDLDGLPVTLKSSSEQAFDRCRALLGACPKPKP